MRICKYCGDPIYKGRFNLWYHGLSLNIHCYNVLHNEIHHATPKDNDQDFDHRRSPRRDEEPKYITSDLKPKDEN